jgi:ATP-binding cassette, subfamily C, bacterial LapB
MESDSDPIVECLALITGLLSQPISTNSLAAGLPLPDDGMTPDLAVQAAKKAGFFARCLTIPLAEISNLTLPCILILNDNKACIFRPHHIKKSNWTISDITH